MKTANPSQNSRRRVIMIAAWLTVLVIVPLGFILSGRFTRALRDAGVGLHPNLNGGRLLAQGTIAASPASVAASPDAAGNDLRNLRSFSIREVRFSRFSGMGIAPRLNLCFEFADRLADPHDSPAHFSDIVLHLFIGESAAGEGGSSIVPSVLPEVALRGGDWKYRVVVDGFHERPRIYDRSGRLVALGLGLYLQSDDQENKNGERARPTLLTAALPADLFKPLRQKPLRFYLVAGAVDTSNASMLRLDEAGRLTDYAALATDGGSVLACDQAGRPLLHCLELPPR